MLPSSKDIPPGGRQDSKFETQVRAAMENVYGVPFVKEKPAWLVNPKTNRRMELDGVNHHLKIGFEAHGEQHYKQVKKWQPTEQDFINQVYRDNIKLDICDAHGYYIITVPYNVQPHQMEAFIRYWDRSAVALRQQREAELYGI